MNIIEYANKLGYHLNSAQIEILNKIQEAKENNQELLICFPRFCGRTMMYDIVRRWENEHNRS